jgi:hypothetical protein
MNMPRTEMAVEIVRQIENEGQFPKSIPILENLLPKAVVEHFH